MQYSTGKDLLGFTPLIGPGGRTADPVQDLLNRVTCTGAVKAGKKGRTIMRAAPDVMRNERGMAIAQRLRDLWIQGCDVRIAYTVMGVDIFRFLGQGTARGPVPKKHLVQDFDGDGEFDNYFHLKALTINGVVRRQPDGFVTLNGSVELVGLRRGLRRELRDPGTQSPTLKYQRFIDYWYENFPTSVAAARGRRPRQGRPATRTSTWTERPAWPPPGGCPPRRRRRDRVVGLRRPGDRRAVRRAPGVVVLAGA